jgi:hypothetical protein
MTNDTSPDSSLDEPFRTILRLQRLRDHRDPGSLSGERLDHAITLAMSARRAGDRHLMRNVRRDARRVLARRFSRLRAIEMNIDALDAAATADDEALPSEKYLSAGPMTPEAVFTRKELCRELEVRVRRFDGFATLIGLVEGLTLAQIAAETGVSLSTTKRCTARIREAATAARRMA